MNVMVGRGLEAHTDPPPLIVAVGNGLTITLTFPPKAVALHPFASANAVTEYAPAGALMIE